MSDCSLRSRGSRFEAAAFLSHSQTKSMSARSFVQDSGARSWALRIRRRRRRSQRKERLCSLLLRAAARTSLIDQTERPNRVTLLDEFGHTGVDLAAGKVIDLQPRHDLVCAAGYRARE